jgi:hypothetical protein
MAGATLQPGSLFMTRPQLAQAQQMSAVKRFFKHISPDVLAQQLANTQQQLWYYDQILSDLQKHMNEAHFTHS